MHGWWQLVTLFYQQSINTSSASKNIPTCVLRLRSEAPTLLWSRMPLQIKRERYQHDTKHLLELGLSAWPRLPEPHLHSLIRRARSNQPHPPPSNSFTDLHDSWLGEFETDSHITSSLQTLSALWSRSNTQIMKVFLCSWTRVQQRRRSKGQQLASALGPQQRKWGVSGMGRSAEDFNKWLKMNPDMCGFTGMQQNNNNINNINYKYMKHFHCIYTPTHIHLHKYCVYTLTHIISSGSKSAGLWLE